jgi:hypothetical protein
MGLMPTPTAVELYELLTQHGFSPEHARRAADIIVTQDEKAHLATREDIADLKATVIERIGDLQYNLMKWGTGLMVAMTAIFSAIVKLFP